MNEFVVYVLRDLVSRIDTPREEELSVKEVDLIRRRLKNLGYL